MELNKNRCGSRQSADERISYIATAKLRMRGCGRNHSCCCDRKRRRTERQQLSDRDNGHHVCVHIYAAPVAAPDSHACWRPTPPQNRHSCTVRSKSQMGFVGRLSKICCEQRAKIKQFNTCPIVRTVRSAEHVCGAQCEEGNNGAMAGRRRQENRFVSMRSLSSLGAGSTDYYTPELNRK
jgi:hypothetical protein